MNRMIKPRVMFITSMIIFGTLGLLVRNIPLGSGEIALYRAILAALMTGGYILISGRKIRLPEPGKEIPLLLASGMALGINWILLFEAYKHTTVSVATLSYYFAPVIVTAVCPVLFREKMTGLQLLCFLASTVGIIMLTGIKTSGNSDLYGILFGLGAAVFYASVVLLNKYIKNVGGIQRTFMQFAASITVLAVYVAVTEGINIGSLSTCGIISLLTVGILHTGITYCMYFSALKEMPGTEAAVLSYIDPLVAVISSVFILGEKITAMQMIGGALILGFTLVHSKNLP